MSAISKLGGLATGMSLAGTYLQYQSYKSQVRAQELTATFNAAENRKQADQIIEQSKEDQRRFRLSFRRDEAQNKVSVAKAGIRLEGSALEVLYDNARMAEEDVERIRKSADIQASQLRKQAILYDYQAGSAKRAGQLGAAAMLLGGASSGLETASRTGVI